jgi:hypothetical protein
MVSAADPSASIPGHEDHDVKSTADHLHAVRVCGGGAPPLT